MQTDGYAPVETYRGYQFIVVNWEWFVIHQASQFVIGTRYSADEARQLVDWDIANNSR